MYCWFVSNMDQLFPQTKAVNTSAIFIYLPRQQKISLTETGKAHFHLDQWPTCSRTQPRGKTERKIPSLQCFLRGWVLLHLGYWISPLYWSLVIILSQSYLAKNLDIKVFIASQIILTLES